MNESKRFNNIDNMELSQIVYNNDTGIWVDY